MMRKIWVFQMIQETIAPEVQILCQVSNCAPMELDDDDDGDLLMQPEDEDDSYSREPQEGQQQPDPQVDHHNDPEDDPADDQSQGNDLGHQPMDPALDEFLEKVERLSDNEPDGLWRPPRPSTPRPPAVDIETDEDDIEDDNEDGNSFEAARTRSKKRYNPVADFPRLRKRTRYPIRSARRAYGFAAEVAARIAHDDTDKKEYKDIVRYLAPTMKPLTSPNTDDELGEPGTDPLPFLPEPKNVRTVLGLPEHLKRPWAKSFVKEVKGLIQTRRCFRIEDPGPDDKIVPLKVVFKCKLDQFGFIDKLKSRICFRGDLHRPSDPEDTWNPHATWPALLLFLSLCAKYGINPFQVDLVQAYTQSKMRDRVFVVLPMDWATLLPQTLHNWLGRPLRVMMALYGHCLSGKCLYEDQAEFLRSYGMKPTTIPSLWNKDLPGKGPNGQPGILLFLHYSDDCLGASNIFCEAEQFKQSIGSRFEAVIKPTVDWYLQARIRRDSAGNILIDQQRYGKGIVQRYLPNASATPSASDLKKYQSPLPTDFKWTKDDCSTNQEEVKELESEYGIRYIEAAGSINFLSNTFYRGLFAARKICGHMHLPGRNHFKALAHFLNHIRCHPVQAIKFHRQTYNSPLAHLLNDAGLSEWVDPKFVAFTDSSFADCDEQRSTGAYLIMVQGGLVDASSFVPGPIAMSSAEAETNANTVGIMNLAMIRQAYCDIVFGSPKRKYTVPVLVDNTAALLMSQNEKDSKRTRHMERCWLFN